jgi:hypothetical protein
MQIDNCDFFMVGPPECPICSGLHDEEIHDATLSIHNWLRHEIERRTEPARFPYAATVEAVAASIY